MASFNQSAFATGALNGPNPFSMPIDPTATGLPTTTTGVPVIQHGSFERYGMDQNPLGTYLDHAGNNWNTPRASPRHSPGHSPRNSDPHGRSRRDDHDSRDRSRDRERPGEPIGVGFRLNSCEQSLQAHHAELAAHKLELNQLKEAVTQLVADKATTGQRLDECFNQVDKVHTECQSQTRQAFDTVEARLKTSADTLNQFSQMVSAKYTSIDAEIEQLKALCQATVGSQSNPLVPPPGMRPPQSWRGPVETPTPSEPEPTAGTSRGQTYGTFGAEFGADLNRSTGPNHQGANPGGQGGPNAYRWEPNAYPTFGHSQSPPNPSGVNGPNRAGPSFYHLGSPGSPLGAPLPQFAAGAGSESRTFDPRDWSVDGKKPSKELKTYDGDMAHFDTWRQRVHDHFIGVNCNYAKVFALIENQKTPIEWAKLRTTVIPDLPYVQWEWIATHLWTFLGGYIDNTLLGRRLTMANGEPYNGMELWRAMYQQNIGGSAALSNLERGYFIDFPKCAKAEDLQPHISLWVQLKNKYGMHIPVDHLIIMFHNILPDGVKEDVKRQKEMKGNLDAQIAHIYSEMGDHEDDKLSRWNLAKMQQQLKLKPKNSTGVHAVNASGSDLYAEVPPPPPPDMASIERMINAAVARGRQQERGRTSDRSPAGSRSGSSQRGGRGRNIPSPKFAGCWCCGEEGHSRQNCKKFKAIKDANGGNVPKDYEGAYEKAQKAHRDKTRETSLKAVQVGPAPPTLSSEHEETCTLFPMMKLPPPVETNNKFSALHDHDSDDDDENDVVKALASLTSNVQLASDKAMSQRERRSKNPQGKRLSHLNAIARKVKSGEITLPDLDLEHDEEWDYVWTMVDSGAGANVARREHFKHSKPVKAPKISLTVANGEVLPNKGARAVTCYDRAGFKKTRVFYEAPVEMPILAVTELAQEGDIGSEVRFRLSDGEILDTQSGRKVPFVKRMGVYFMKVYFPKETNAPPMNNQGFVRQDP